MKKIIGIFGMSGDPPHRSHKAIIDHCIKEKLVDEIWVLPTFNHPHKKNGASFEQRFKMCQMMFTRRFYPVRVKNLEICNTTGTTLNMLKVLKWLMPKYDFQFIIGSDCADNIQSWYRPEELIHQVPFIVFEREDYVPKNLNTWYLVKPHCLISVKDCGASSTTVRKLVKHGLFKLVRILTNKKVVKYIQKERIYENYSN